ncbi:MAG TPA: hypothetical protein VIC62_02360, partial [Nakamurella sp.]
MITNCGVVASSTADPDPDDNRACVTTHIDPPVPVAEVAVSKSGPATAHAGDTISYTLSVTNHGPDAATDLLVKDPLNASLVTAATLPAGCSLSGDNTVLCDAGTLGVDETKTFTITVTVAGGLASGTHIDNCGQATSTSTLLNPIPQDACITTVIVPPLSADVAVAKTGPAAVAPGGTISYTLTATDN